MPNGFFTKSLRILKWKGHTLEVFVDSAREGVHIQLELESGERYRFIMDGTWSCDQVPKTTLWEILGSIVKLAKMEESNDYGLSVSEYSWENIFDTELDGMCINFRMINGNMIITIYFPECLVQRFRGKHFVAFTLIDFNWKLMKDGWKEVDASGQGMPTLLAKLFDVNIGEEDDTEDEDEDEDDEADEIE